MDAEPAAQPPTPRPGLLKTVGALNVLFGAVLLLCCGGGLTLLGPSLAENPTLQVGPELAQEVVNDIRRQMADNLRQKERAASDPAEKQRWKDARQDVEAGTAKLAAQVDFREVNAALPWLARYLWADALTGPVLNLAMVAAGVGLLRLKGWGRALAVWVAWLKIARLAALGAFLALAVVPRLGQVFAQLAKSEFGQMFLRRAMEQSPIVPVSGARLDPDEVVRILTAYGYAYALMSLALGAIYPVIVLVVLTRPAARAACSGTGSEPAGPA